MRRTDRCGPSPMHWKWHVAHMEMARRATYTRVAPLRRWPPIGLVEGLRGQLACAEGVAALRRLGKHHAALSAPLGILRSRKAWRHLACGHNVRVALGCGLCQHAPLREGPVPGCAGAAQARRASHLVRYYREGNNALPSSTSLARSRAGIKRFVTWCPCESLGASGAEKAGGKFATFLYPGQRHSLALP